MTPEERASLVDYRVELAESRLRTADRAIADDDFLSAANRLYYAALAMLSAVLIERGIQFRSHRGARRMLGLHLVAPGHLPREAAAVLAELEQRRDASDYGDFVEISAHDIETQKANCRGLIEPLRGLLEST